MDKKIFIIAGEASGDLLGASIIKSIKKENSGFSIKFIGIGGPKMESEGLDSMFPMEKLSVMGIFEVLPVLFSLLRKINQTVKKILAEKPDIIITIDSPGFCFKVLEKLQKKNKTYFNDVKKVHVVAPSVWAYKEKRAKKVAKLYNLLLCLLPFEPPYFEKYGLKAEFIGHPIFDQKDKYKKENCNRKEILNLYGVNTEDILLILTPGSRESEIARIFPIMINAVNILNEEFNKEKRDLHVFTFANRNTEDLVSFLKHEHGFPTVVVSRDTEKIKLMNCANMALAKSGTNTFEFNIFGIPLVITYTMNWFTNIIAKKIIKVKYANIVNIMADREIIPEFLGGNAQPDAIASKLDELIRSRNKANKQVNDAREIIKTLGYESNVSASKKAAEKIIGLLNV